jgi:hypothetical protein
MRDRMTTSSAKLICPVCGTHYGEAGCPHSPAGSTPPGGLRAVTPPAAPPTPSGFIRTAAAPAAPTAPPPTQAVGASSTAPGAAQARAPGAQGVYVGAEVVPEGDYKISALGFERSGKTTFLGMLYFLVTTGRLPGYRFAWSDSLRDLEQIRAQLHRPLGQGGPTFPPRTDTDKTVFMHLGLRRWDDARYFDLYFPEFSGEDVARIWTDGQFPKNLNFLQYFDGYLVFVDATSTSAMDVGRYLRLISGLLELKGTLRLAEPVAILLSKWDLVAGEDGATTPEEFFRERFGGLHDALKGQLEEFRVFAVSSVGKVRTLLGHDGLPIKRDGAVMHVPAPERTAGEAEEDEPVFSYHPLNLSRPVLWLLDQLAAREKAASAPAGGAR